MRRGEVGGVPSPKRLKRRQPDGCDPLDEVSVFRNFVVGFLSACWVTMMCGSGGEVVLSLQPQQTLSLPFTKMPELQRFVPTILCYLICSLVIPTQPFKHRFLFFWCLKNTH